MIDLEFRFYFKGFRELRKVFLWEGCGRIGTLENMFWGLDGVGGGGLLEVTVVGRGLRLYGER